MDEGLRRLHEQEDPGYAGILCLSQEIKLHVVDVHKVPKCFVQSLRRGIDAVIVCHCL